MIRLVRLVVGYCILFQAGLNVKSSNAVTRLWFIIFSGKGMRPFGDKLLSILFTLLILLDLNASGE